MGLCGILGLSEVSLERKTPYTTSPKQDHLDPHSVSLNILSFFQLMYLSDHSNSFLDNQSNPQVLSKAQQGSEPWGGVLGARIWGQDWGHTGRQRPTHLRERIYGMVIHEEVNCVEWTESVTSGEGDGCGLQASLRFGQGLGFGARAGLEQDLRRWAKSRQIL